MTDSRSGERIYVYTLFVFKYAGGNNLLVTGYIDVSISNEFTHVEMHALILMN